ncbi:uncharacterized protein LOC141802850 [Halichoeres trimaculatus]|uniref:uncharacterized protein LOC141802850 n=1 Tax=Halichoeres trimaculatus TaxID=147232 RepID=UPI003D9F6F1A
MNLWFSGLLLVVGLSMSSADPTEEECRVMTTPKATFTPMYGRWTFIMGWSDNPVFDELFRTTRSQWIDFIHSPTDTPNEIHEDVGLKDSTRCKYYSTVLTVVGNSAISRRSNFTCTFHSLPTCPYCLLYHTTAISNNNLVAPKTTPTGVQELASYKTYYLMATRPALKPEHIQYAKDQAKCLGFKEEPTFHFDPLNKANSLCDKERGD